MNRYDDAEQAMFLDTAGPGGLGASGRLPSPVVIQTNPASPVTDSGWPGIGRLVAIRDYLLVNNLYRNFELYRFRDDAVSGCEAEIEQRLHYNDAIYPGEDDLHAAYSSACGRYLLAVNHYGNVQCFEWARIEAGAPLRPSHVLQLAGDTERIVLAGDCLVASSIRGYQVPDSQQPGILISQPLTPLFDLLTASATPRRLDYRVELPEWGFISSLAVSTDSRRLAVASQDRIGLFSLEDASHGLRLGACLWEAKVAYSTQWIAFDPMRQRVLFAGYNAAPGTPESYSWDECRGGGMTVFSLTGERLRHAPLPDATAWGYGGALIVLSQDATQLYAVDRFAGLHALSLETGIISQLYAGHYSATGKSAGSLGIAHAAVFRRTLYAGFSRGGYRLFRYSL